MTPKAIKQSLKKRGAFADSIPDEVGEHGGRLPVEGNRRPDVDLHSFIACHVIELKEPAHDLRWRIFVEQRQHLEGARYVVNDELGRQRIQQLLTEAWEDALNAGRSSREASSL
jgi:hypothetical protein